GIQFAVEHLEHVAVEIGGDARGVVIRRHQAGGFFDQVQSQEKYLTRVHRVGKVGEAPAALLRRVVADRAAQERDQSGAGSGQQVEVAVDVGDDRLDGQPRALVRERGGRLAKRAATHVDGDVALQGPRTVHDVQQQAGLLRGARAQLEEDVRACVPGDV